MTLFEVRPDDLGRLDPAGSVNLFRKLIWAEATTLGIPKNKIDVPSAINDDDGGVDASVSSTITNEGLIKNGLTCYQIKTGPFSLSVNASDEIKKFLFTKRENNYVLKPKIKYCFDNDGTFVLVLFGSDRAERELDQIISTFKEKLMEECGDAYKNAKIEVLKQNQIIGFLEPYVSLRLSILGMTGEFYSHNEWKKFDDMFHQFKQNKKLQEQLQKFQDELQKSDSSKDIRVIGEPGMGKTRFVLEAMDTEHLAPLVVYVENPDALHHENFLTQCIKYANSLILVVDECDSSTHKKIWNKIKYNNSKIKLITISNEFDPDPSLVRLIELEGLGDDEIKAILKDYDVPSDKISQCVSFCRPSPRAAHSIGYNFKYHQSLLNSSNVVDMCDCYIAGRTQINSEEFEKRKTVLMWISLFKKFGYVEPFEDEGKFIAKKIKEISNITYNDFTSIIQKLKSMKILQGGKTLYITSKILHIKLWTLWWERYGGPRTFTPEDMLIEEDDKNPQVSANIIKWYGDMLKYAKESQYASKAIKHLLRPQGLFAQNNLLQTELGGSFFLAIVGSDPKAAMVFLKDTVGVLSREQLLESDYGRRHVVWALESIAMRKHLFHDAARLLLKLGEAETETWANNASGVFTSLFSLMSGRGASTELSPKDRIIILNEALNSDSEPQIMLGLESCNTILETRSWTSLKPIIEPGLQDDLNPWTPKSDNEYVEIYKICLELLDNYLEKYTGNPKNKLIEILLGRAREFFILSEFSEIYFKIIAKIMEFPEYKEKTISTLIDVLHYEQKKLTDDVTKRLTDLKDQMVGNSFHSLLERHVGMDIMLDKFNDSGKYDEEANKKEILELVNTALDAEKLRPELKWLMTEKAKNAYRFGYELGRKDSQFSLLSMILEEQTKILDSPSVSLLGGYFRSTYETKRSMWEAELEKMAQSDLKKWIPEIASRIGLTDKVGMIILNLIQNGACDVSVLKYFKFGGVITGLSEKVANQWFEHLISRNELASTITAIDLFNGFYIFRQKEEIPLPLGVEILTHTTLQNPATPINDIIIHFSWSGIAKRIIQESTEYGLKIIDVVLRNFETDSFFGRYGSQIREVLAEMTEKEPRKTWQIISKYLGPPVDSRALNIKNWLRDNNFKSDRNMLECIPFDDICKWVEEDKELRSRYLATFLKPEIPILDSLTWQFIVKYGEDKQVRSELLRNFFNESWSGSASEHYTGKKEEILQIKQDIIEPNVITWIDEYIQSLDRKIEFAKDFEEREF